MQRSKLVRAVVTFALLVAPLAYGGLATGGVAAHDHLFDEHSHREQVALEARLVERGMTAEQARAIADYEAGQSSRVASYVQGASSACITMAMMLGLTLAALIARGGLLARRSSGPAEA